MVAAIERWHRPDGKLFLFPDDPWSPELAAAARQIADAAQRAVRAEADATSAAEIEALQAAGFVVARREARVRIPFAEAVGVLDGADLPPGIETISAIMPTRPACARSTTNCAATFPAPTAGATTPASSTRPRSPGRSSTRRPTSSPST